LQWFHLHGLFAFSDVTHVLPKAACCTAFWVTVLCQTGQCAFLWVHSCACMQVPLPPRGNAVAVWSAAACQEQQVFAQRGLVASHATSLIACHTHGSVPCLASGLVVEGRRQCCDALQGAMWSCAARVCPFSVPAELQRCCFGCRPCTPSPRCCIGALAACSLLVVCL
jgi:hypothetical protein